MYTVTLPVHTPVRFASPIGTAATAASAMFRPALAIAGTGSAFDLSRARDWRTMLQPRVPFIVDVDAPADTPAQRPDLRTAAEHLANIRQVLNPAIADLASVLGVSRQAIYKWIGGDTTPEVDRLDRVCALSLAADAFHDAGVSRASALLMMKVFEGRSLMDLAASGELRPGHVQILITEAKAMEAAYDRSGLARTKAKPSDDWQTEVSMPGSPE